MIAVDQDGGIHIIDFKTSKKSFTRKSGGKLILRKLIQDTELAGLVLFRAVDYV